MVVIFRPMLALEIVRRIKAWNYIVGFLAR